LRRDYGGGPYLQGREVVGDKASNRRPGVSRSDLLAFKGRFAPSWHHWIFSFISAFPVFPGCFRNAETRGEQANGNAETIEQSRTAEPTATPHIGVPRIVGASGSGKSSLVFAGLLPALRKESQTRTWDVVSFRPGKAPLGALATAFGTAPENAGPAEIDAYFDQTRPGATNTDREVTHLSRNV
jgi:hypothetical protein